MNSLSRMNSIGALGEVAGKRKKVQKPSDIPGLRRKKAKKVRKRGEMSFSSQTYSPHGLLMLGRQRGNQQRRLSQV